MTCFEHPDRLCSWPHCRCADIARTKIAHQDAEIERLQARLDAMGTVTEYDAKGLYNFVGALGVHGPDPVPWNAQSESHKRLWFGALEAFVKGKEGDATSEVILKRSIPENYASNPALQSHDQACGADLHGRGKFGGPLAEQYVEQAGKAESDAAFVERMTGKLPGFGYSFEVNEIKLLIAIARRATTPDPRDAQIAKLREALEPFAQCYLDADGQAVDAYFIADRCYAHTKKASRVLEETRGES